MLRVGVHSGIRDLLQKVQELVLKSPRLHKRVNICAYEPGTTCQVLLVDPDLLCGLYGDADAKTNIRWIQSTFSGAEKLCDVSTFRDDLVVTRIGRGFGSQMGEYCMAYILQDALMVKEMAKDENAKAWRSDVYKRERFSLDGKVLGVLGAGAIGTAVALTAKAFGMKTIGLTTGRTISSSSCSGSGSGSSDEQTRAFSPLGISTSLTEVLEKSDYIVNCLPSTPQTRGLLSTDSFKSGIIGFINVGRGDVVADDELIAAIDSNMMKWAVLDVFSKEPLPDISPLWSHPAVTITPHVSAISTPDVVASVFIENLELFLGLGLDGDSGSGSGSSGCDGDDSSSASLTSESIIGDATKLRYRVHIQRGY